MRLLTRKRETSKLERMMAFSAVFAASERGQMTAERVKMELKIGICVKRWPQNDDHNVWSELDLVTSHLRGSNPRPSHYKCDALPLSYYNCQSVTR